MGFVTNGEHDQMMRDQQRDLRRIADALEQANHIKVIEIAMMHCQGQYNTLPARYNIGACIGDLLKANGWTFEGEFDPQPTEMPEEIRK